MMSRRTGLHLAPLEHLWQSVADIITTPIGSRAMRRDYGSLVPMLVDQPDNPATQTRLYAASAGALMRWEPRLQTVRARLLRDPGRPGSADLEVSGQRVGDWSRKSAPVRLSIPLANRGGA